MAERGARNGLGVAVPDKEELQGFFEEMARALTEGDAKRVAECWAVPGLFVTDVMAAPVESHEQVREIFEANIGLYRSKGITATSPEIVAIHNSTARLVAVDVRWPYLDATGTPKGEEVSSYVVWIDDEGKPRIRVGYSLGSTSDPF